MKPDSLPVIASCGIPPLIQIAVNAMADDFCLQEISPQDLANRQIAGCMVDIAVFAQNPELFMPHRHHIALWDARSNQIFTHDIDEKRYPEIHLNDDPQSCMEILVSLLKRNNLPGIDTAASATLSQRERDVLRQIASGKTNKEIADVLNISINTVITHRKNLSAKLGIRSASGLSLYALMNGYI